MMYIDNISERKRERERKKEREREGWWAEKRMRGERERAKRSVMTSARRDSCLGY